MAGLSGPVYMRTAVSEAERTNWERNERLRLAEGFLLFSRRILDAAARGLPRQEFVRLALNEFLKVSGCDAADLRVDDGARCFRGWIERDSGSFRMDMLPRVDSANGESPLRMEADSPALAGLCADLHRCRSDKSLFSFAVLSPSETGRPGSLALVPFPVGADGYGLLLLSSRQAGFFHRSEGEIYEAAAQTLGAAFFERRTQVALRERVKELTCLYGLAKVLEEPNLEIRGALARIVQLLPPAWLYAEIASARIVLDGQEYVTPGFRPGSRQLRTGIVVGDRERGSIEVCYSEPRPELDEGPFLKEERNLIVAVARELSLFVERHEAALEKTQLEAQLRHADRLATIGQLAAGVAHELNEPLGNILGFAQLALKAEEMPGRVRSDIDRVVQAALHAREVVSKLMLFARQKPPTKEYVQLNELVEDGLYFLGARCAKAGIELVRELAPGLPAVNADAAQLHQVLVNLVVNAIQAMPRGGRLVVRTEAGDRAVALVVEDTGVGMSEDVLNRIFVPFFTTKPVGEGTGLGLSVVHGIVEGHGGAVEVESKPGKGTRFRVVLPAKGPQDK
uniref:histidine kinase n=1 Tax=candidate division WOR-3 bacterium TaxID=2052148 RepID=A0A7C4CCA4_UNCW3